MGALKKLTEDQVAEIAELRERGCSYGFIARRFGVSQGCALYHCLKQGAVSPNTRPSGQKVMTYQRGGKPVRRFTASEDERLLALRAAGTPVMKIARELGRAYTSVRLRLLALEARAEGYAGGAPAHG